MSKKITHADVRSLFRTFARMFNRSLPEDKQMKLSLDYNNTEGGFLIVEKEGGVKHIPFDPERRMAKGMASALWMAISVLSTQEELLGGD